VEQLSDDTANGGTGRQAATPVEAAEPHWDVLPDWASSHRSLPRQKQSEAGIGWMLYVAIALLSGLGWGVGDFTGGKATQRAGHCRWCGYR
jgi:hypothetical protein